MTGYAAAIAPQAQTLLRAGYGALLLGQLVATAPNARRFLVSRSFGGYMESSSLVDRVHTPRNAVILMALWCACRRPRLDVATLRGWPPINAGLAWYLFVRTRWSSILRGMGAPGHMSCWLALLVLLLTFSRAYDVDGLLRASTIAVFRLDFACILIVAGIAKIAAGYARNDGLQMGLANPSWGRYPALFRRLRADAPIVRAINHLAYLSELLAGIALLVPALAPYGALVVTSSFLVVGRVIRLTGLAEMMALCGLLFVPPDHPLTAFLAAHVPAAASAPSAPPWARPLVVAGIASLWLYALCLPLAYGGMALNFYGRRRMIEPFQSALETWTRACGISLWRVFTSDIISFSVEIWAERRDGRRRPIAASRNGEPPRDTRRAHVAESIVLATLFTTLTYHPDDRERFGRRLVIYAATLPLAPGERALFRYVRGREGGGASALSSGRRVRRRSGGGASRGTRRR